MNIIADTHCHTIVSSHAYSTLTENFHYAASIGLKYLAITDHGPQMVDAPHYWHFANMGAMPDYIEGVRILRGIELNILNSSGEIDLSEEYLKGLEWVIASMHNPLYVHGNLKENTDAYINVAKNPYVDVIGHCGNEDFKFDYEKGVKAFKEYGKLVEINNASFMVRRNSPANCKEIALLCKKYDVPVVVSSDSHYHLNIGKFDKALALLDAIDFPERLVINSNEEKFTEFLKNRR